MSGWTMTGAHYGAWSGNKTGTNVSESDTVHIVGQSTKYFYHHYHNSYTNGTSGIDSTGIVGTTGSDGVTIASNLHYCSLETSEALPATSFADVGGQQAYKKSGTYNCSYNNYNNWWYDGATTIYTYQTRSIDYYTFERWTDYSDWSFTQVQPISGKRQVKERWVYSYSDRSQITTYHFKRKVYGAWSDWSDTPVESSSTLDVETREEYIY